ncbi:BnaA01g18600D [Brassica napus]|uniref:BnaA01g18600D protein n=1 Tax=Brassica napus TaxID=3708 RepID=A0A078GCZ7_BRANA|nr:BnaA01g18600D [Brassica napus]
MVAVQSTERVKAVYPLLKDVALSPDMSFCVDCLFEGF